MTLPAGDTNSNLLVACFGLFLGICRCIRNSSDGEGLSVSGSVSVKVCEGLWLSVPLILAFCHSSHRCQQVGRLPIASVAHLTIWGEAGGAKMSEISTGVSSSNHACQAISVYINLWNNVQPSQLAHGGHFVAFGLLTGLAHFEVDLSHEFTLQWVNSRVVDAWSVKTQWPEAKFLYRASL